jgi:NACHT domain
MTRFSGDKNKLTPLEWSDLAVRNLQKNKDQFSLLACLGIALVLGSATSSITGLIAGVWTFQYHFSKGRERQENITAIIENGCVAHVLEGKDFKSYSRQVGAIALERELKFARDMGLKFSPDAEEYLDAIQKEQNISLVDGAPPSTISSQIEEFSPGINDVVSLMSDRVSNSFIVGIAGSGKGMLVANVMRAIKSKHPTLKIFFIDPKNDPKEHGYTNGVADKIMRHKCETEEPEVVREWIDKCFKEFDEYAKGNERTLLILDEGTVLANKLKIVKSTILLDRLNSLISLGDSTGKNLFFIAQSPFVGASGIDLSASSQMVTIAIVSAENRGSLAQWKRSSILKSLSNLDELISKSPVKRAYYFGKTDKWYPMPKLINFSDYNRDTRTTVEGLDYDAKRKEFEAIFDEKIQPESKELITGLSKNASIILSWLTQHRFNQWVKFKGKDERDMTFINFLSDKSIRLEERDKIIEELVKLKKIILSSDNNSLMLNKAS